MKKLALITSGLAALAVSATMLHAAAVGGNVDLMELVLAEGGDPLLRNDTQYACRRANFLGDQNFRLRQHGVCGRC